MVEANGFTIALQKCEHSGDSVTFYFLVTNNKEDRKFGLHASSCRIFDNYGNEYTADTAQVGKYTSNSYCWTILVENVPIKANVNFVKVASQAEYIKILELAYYNDNGDFKVQFRNVQFLK